MDPPLDNVVAPDAHGLARACAALWAGELVGFPTETVYGLGADAMDESAVARIFAAKGRPADNPLIVHLPDAEHVGPVVDAWTPLARRLAEDFWPGPLTLVLDAASQLPRVTTGGLATVAVRVPDHPVAQTLLWDVGRPLAAPSANRSGRPSPTEAAHVSQDLGDAVRVVLDGGPCPVGVESTVVDARGRVPLVLREGSITREDLGAAETVTDGDRLRASPGTRYRHYAPTCRVAVAAAGTAAATAHRLMGEGVTVGLVATEPPPPGVVGVARFVDAADLARQLYAALRTAETAGVGVVVVEAVGEAGVGRAVMDRLRRAAG
ncbi:L-threonylcarbamoyladenylate synthase [Egicoccus sp. AB-alg6-2]|uniref:L-threonylcarbamoyladenylate synthase n=1 Tax=Egicoccus sp. AB-alg6-2 TaxID=3242692 RepID=UPI00359DF948